jgi:hypothetical protein
MERSTILATILAAAMPLCGHAGENGIPDLADGMGMGGTSANLRALALEARVLEGPRFAVSVSAEELATRAKKAVAQ